ncbi:cell filamentation protein Fic [Bacteroidia bacterium]|nr:cell filamentation protein Fic [Bacteroidia bacterium]
MDKETQIWQSIEAAMEEFRQLQLEDVVDYKKFYLYSIITHSTAIEGSTLTELDTQLLFDDGITAHGKQLVHHLMNTDLKAAYDFAILKAKTKTPITVNFLKELNALVMHTTGSPTSVIGGTFDSSKGDFRLCGVTAGVGGKSYMNYQKVPEKVSEMCNALTIIADLDELRDIYNISFDAHFDLVTIHPWVDGNGRTARLLMHYIQFYHNVFPTKIRKEDTSKYIASLVESQKAGVDTPFREFMAQQLLTTLQEETAAYKQSQEKDFHLCLKTNKTIIV